MSGVRALFGLHPIRAFFSRFFAAGLRLEVAPRQALARRLAAIRPPSSKMRLRKEPSPWAVLQRPLDCNSGTTISMTSSGQHHRKAIPHAIAWQQRMSGTGLRRDNQGERPATIKMSERRKKTPQ